MSFIDYSENIVRLKLHHETNINKFTSKYIFLFQTSLILRLLGIYVCSMSIDESTDDSL